MLRVGTAQTLEPEPVRTGVGSRALRAFAPLPNERKDFHDQRQTSCAIPHY